jgi:hypothetical protein
MALYIEELLYKDTRIKVLTDKKSFVKTAFDEVVRQRSAIEDYISSDPLFLSALKPYKIRADAPKIVRLMSEGGKIAGVGPMAAVAGTISELTARKMIKEGAKVAIVENGGDIFAVSDREVTIGLFSGNNDIVEKLAFRLDESTTPLSVCSSSSLLGHSLSFGRCDLATVFSRKSHVADAAATAAANKVKNINDIEPVLNWLVSLRHVQGAIIIKDSKVGMIGDIPRLLLSKDKKLKDKVTKDTIYEF